MKKFLSLLLAFFMLLSISTCADIISYKESSLANDPDYESFKDYETIDVTEEIPGELHYETEAPTLPQTEPPTDAPTEPPIDEDGWYYSVEDVALYLYTYGYLPENFITKQEARSMGWSSGSVEYYAEGCAIGGDRFGNREGLLPKAQGRQYYECDIDTNGFRSRGAKRIVYSNDGLIDYTDDHYESFTLLYGEE